MSEGHVTTALKNKVVSTVIVMGQTHVTVYQGGDLRQSSWPALFALHWRDTIIYWRSAISVLDHRGRWCLFRSITMDDNRWLQIWAYVSGLKSKAAKHGRAGKEGDMLYTQSDLSSPVGTTSNHDIVRRSLVSWPFMATTLAFGRISWVCESAEVPTRVGDPH